MASSRQIARLVAMTGSVSSGAIRTAMGHTQVPRGGLAILPDLIALVAETTCVSSKQENEAVERLGTYYARLVLRYGTLRRVFEAFASGRRRHAMVSNERASAWAQIMSVSPGALEGTLERHAWLRIHLVQWATRYGSTLMQRLSDFEAWLDGPLPGSDGEDELPLLEAIARETQAHSALTPAQAPTGVSDEGPGDVVAADGGIAMSSDTIETTPAQRGDAARIASLLDDKRPGDWASDWRLSEEDCACAERLTHDPSARARVLGALALRDLTTVDALVEDIEGDDVERHTRAGDRWYFKSDFERAVERYREARKLRDDDVRRRNVALALLRLERGGAINREDATREALDLLMQTVSDRPAGSRERGCALVILGLAWMASGTRDRDHALHEALRCFEQAAGIFDISQAPAWWAETRLHLAHAWLDMPTGDRFSNVEHAIGSLRQTEHVWTRETAPERWATAQNSQGTAWERLPSSDRSMTLRKAIACFERALEVRTREAHPAHWARLQNNLGNALIQLGSRDRNDTIERGIACHQDALQVWSSLGRRQEWAATQSNLGNAWALLPGDASRREKHMRRAIACYRSALEVRTKSTHPSEWAGTLNNLGSALLHLPISGRGTHVREAIECFTGALEVRTRDAYPVDWAKTQSNLGLAWALLPGDREEHLTEAVACYDSALDVLTPQAHPGASRHVAARREKAKDQLAALA